MNMRKTNYILHNKQLESELEFSASRSGGPGGQNVNKVNTKVELRFKIAQSAFLTESEKQKIEKYCKNKINSNGELIISSQTERSQLKNKEKAIERFQHLIAMALKPIKPRKATKPTPTSIEKRLSNKKILSEKKKFRGKIL
ncbi:MAG TPA: alternative ribosome rescue aminoacyl-tRNA hydrolase ArfB [Prolixibacteraceae bacterium]|nr:alternative ribosome rescue aminoacyl-tRNA hydrolase ArfB [Prolixibacteraceae bacterium]HPR61298.1 alternative ribosome rescue aminoacyl-tRNA hydrolase ArfB [Prolixibacteraceae bacterium]